MLSYNTDNLIKMTNIVEHNIIFIRIYTFEHLLSCNKLPM